MNKHAKAQSSIDAQPFGTTDIENPAGAWSAATPQGTIQEQLQALRRRIAELTNEIDAMAIAKAPGAEGIRTTKALVADKRNEIQRLKACLVEIERLLAPE